MPSFTIPQQHENGFKYFFEIEKSQRDILANVIISAQIGISYEEIVNILIEKLNINKDKLECILRMIISLHKLKEYGKPPTDILIEGITKALLNTKKKELIPPTDFKQIFTDILSTKSWIYYNIKTEKLVIEREKNFLECRILSDIRPVFTDEKDLNIKGYTIIHNLKIVFKDHGDNRNIKEIFISVDKDDLNNIKNSIIRAEKKEKNVKENLVSTGIPIIEY